MKCEFTLYNWSKWSFILTYVRKSCRKYRPVQISNDFCKLPTPYRVSYTDDLEDFYTIKSTDFELRWYRFELVWWYNIIVLDGNWCPFIYQQLYIEILPPTWWLLAWCGCPNVLSVVYFSAKYQYARIGTNSVQLCQGACLIMRLLMRGNWPNSFLGKPDRKQISTIKIHHDRIISHQQRMKSPLKMSQTYLQSSIQKRNNFKSFNNVTS